jgi:hypothetical protein
MYGLKPVPFKLTDCRACLCRATHFSLARLCYHEDDCSSAARYKDFAPESGLSQRGGRSQHQKESFLCH